MKCRFIVINILISLQIVVFTHSSFAGELTERCQYEATKASINFNVAEPICKAAILTENDNTEAYFWHGHVLLKRSNILLLKGIIKQETLQERTLRQDIIREAISDFSIVIDRLPNDVQARVNRGVAYRNIKDYRKAFYDFNQALILDTLNLRATNE